MQSFHVNSYDLLRALKEGSSACGNPKHVTLRNQLYFLSVECVSGKGMQASKIVHLDPANSKPRAEGSFRVERKLLKDALEKSDSRTIGFINKAEGSGFSVSLPGLRRLPATFISSDVPKGAAEEGSAWISEDVAEASAQIQHATGKPGSGCEDIVVVSAGTSKKPRWDIYAGNQTDMFAF